MSNPFRSLPAVNDVLACEAVHALAGRHARAQIVAAVRAELDELRRRLGRGEGVDGSADAEAVAARAARRLEREDRPKLVRIINATGVVLHTNLGRAPLAA